MPPTSPRERLGLTPGGGGRHEALGTFNRLVWLGDTYIELIGVFDRDLAATSWIGAPTLRALDAGGGLATWAIATDAIDDDVGRASSPAARTSPNRSPANGAGPMARSSAGDSPRRRGSTPTRPPFLIEHDPGRPNGRRPTGPLARSDPPA